MTVTKVFHNGDFHCQETKFYKDGEMKCEFDVSQVTHFQEVKVGDEIGFTDYRFKTVKFTKDGRQQSKIIILSFGFKVD